MDKEWNDKGLVTWCIMQDNWTNIHSKQLCVPFRIFLRVGSDSSFGILVQYRSSTSSPTRSDPPLAGEIWSASYSHSIGIPRNR
jgi:hypothetical protein